MENSDFSLQGFTNCVEIDRGGSAVIYRADQPEFGRQVAIKVLSSFRDPAAIERFNTERKTMGQLSHAQGIVSVYASGMTEQGDPYLVLPFYETGSLQDEIDYYGALRWRKAAQHVIEVCRSVDFAHSKGVYHRDIKPANLLVADDGNVHIADFGIASLALAEPGEQMLCTPAYAPPEVLWGDTTANPISIDVYGLGASLWALLEGGAPFHNMHAGEQPGFEHYTMRSWATTHQLEDFADLVNTEPVADLRHIVPDPICATIEQAMSKAPQDRFSSARALGNALRYSIRLSAEQMVQKQPSRLSTFSSHNTLVAERVGAPGSILVEEPPTYLMESTEQIPTTSSSPFEQESATSIYAKPKEPLLQGRAGKIPVPPPPGSQIPEEISRLRVGSSLLILSAIVVLVVVAGVGLLFAANADGSAPGGVVGDYVGVSVEEANVDALEAGWLIEEVPVRRDGTVAGNVVEQTISPGTDLDGGKTLTLRVSQGSEIRRIPTLVGLSETEAREKLEQANLAVGNVTEAIDEVVSLGRVSQILVDGSEPEIEYETGTKIDLVLSLGPEQVTIPLVETPEEAENVFEEELGFLVVFSEEFSDRVDVGKVIRTDPAVGTKASPGEEITVFVSAGSQSRDIPDVVGKKPEDAIKELLEKGFEVKQEDQPPNNCAFKLIGETKKQCDNYADGKVWNYSPKGEADAGSEIKILAKN